MAFFDYGAAAELFPSRHKTRMMGAVTYMRFAAAAEAIRYAVEEIPANSFRGAFLESKKAILHSNQHACPQGSTLEDLTGRGSPERKREDARTSGLTSSISWWFPMTEPCGINVLLDLHIWRFRWTFTRRNR